MKDLANITAEDAIYDDEEDEQDLMDPQIIIKL